MFKGNAVVGQSGGPTSVINSSLAGVIKACLKSDRIKEIYGMNYGIEGLMKSHLINLGKQPAFIIDGLKATPSSALGSSRHKVKDEDFPVILKCLKKYNIRYFFLIGGNDSMDTINRVEKYCLENNYELIGAGIPKTVDNDLYGTDHTPGFASAALSNILNVKQAGILARDMQKVDKYVIYQTIGRDAGWLGAATALGSKREEDAPHLIYCPEFDFDREMFLEDVKKCIDSIGWVSIVCGEGLKYKDGRAVSSSETRDKFNNVEFGAMGGASVGMNLHKMINEEFDYRGEFQITESLIMCAADRAVKTDIEEAYQCGIEAVMLAEKEQSGFMVTIDRISDFPYKIKFGKILLSEVAIKAKPMPKYYFNERGNYVNEKFHNYIKPLIGELPEYVELNKRIVKDID